MESDHDRKGRTANGKNGGRMINCSANLPFCKSADAGGCESHEHLYEPEPALPSAILTPERIPQKGADRNAFIMDLY